MIKIAWSMSFLGVTRGCIIVQSKKFCRSFEKLNSQDRWIALPRIAYKFEDAQQVLVTKSLVILANLRESAHDLAGLAALVDGDVGNPRSSYLRNATASHVRSYRKEHSLSVKRSSNVESVADLIL